MLLLQLLLLVPLRRTPPRLRAFRRVFHLPLLFLRAFYLLLHFRHRPTFPLPNRQSYRARAAAAVVYISVLRHAARAATRLQMIRRYSLHVQARTTRLQVTRRHSLHVQARTPSRPLRRMRFHLRHRHRWSMSLRRRLSLFPVELLGLLPGLAGSAAFRRLVLPSASARFTPATTYTTGLALPVLCVLWSILPRRC